MTVGALSTPAGDATGKRDRDESMHSNGAVSRKLERIVIGVAVIFRPQVRAAVLARVQGISPCLADLDFRPGHGDSPLPGSPVKDQVPAPEPRTADPHGRCDAIGILGIDRNPIGFLINEGWDAGNHGGPSMPDGQPACPPPVRRYSGAVTRVTRMSRRSDISQVELVGLDTGRCRHQRPEPDDLADRHGVGAGSACAGVHPLDHARSHAVSLDGVAETQVGEHHPGDVKRRAVDVPVEGSRTEGEGSLIHGFHLPTDQDENCEPGRRDEDDLGVEAAHANRIW